MFSRPARMMEKMVGMMPIKSTRFILSVRNLLLFGQTSSRRKYLILTFGKQTSVFTLCSRRTHSMTKKAVAMLSMMCNITSTSSCSLIASMRKIPEQKENSSFAFCLGFSKSSLFRIIPESNTEEINPSLHNCVFRCGKSMCVKCCSHWWRWKPSEWRWRKVAEPDDSFPDIQASPRLPLVPDRSYCFF